MVKFTKENGKIVNSTEQELIHGPIKALIQGRLKMAINMVKGFINQKTAKYLKGSGKMAKEMERED